MTLALLVLLLGAPDAGPLVSQAADGAREINAQRFNALLADPTKLARGARVIPHFENGESTGFKLFGIRRGSLYAEMGFRNGDVVRSVNGHALGTPDAALKAYTALRGAKELVFAITRRSADHTLRLRVVDGPIATAALPEPSPLPKPVNLVGKLRGSFDFELGEDDTVAGRSELVFEKVRLKLDAEGGLNLGDVTVRMKVVQVGRHRVMNVESVEATGGDARVVLAGPGAIYLTRGPRVSVSLDLTLSRAFLDSSAGKPFAADGEKQRLKCIGRVGRLSCRLAARKQE